LLRDAAEGRRGRLLPAGEAQERDEGAGASQEEGPCETGGWRDGSWLTGPGARADSGGRAGGFWAELWWVQAF